MSKNISKKIPYYAIIFYDRCPKSKAQLENPARLPIWCGDYSAPYLVSVCLPDGKHRDGITKEEEEQITNQIREEIHSSIEELRNIYTHVKTGNCNCHIRYRRNPDGSFDVYDPSKPDFPIYEFLYTVSKVDPKRPGLNYSEIADLMSLKDLPDCVKKETDPFTRQDCYYVRGTKIINMDGLENALKKTLDILSLYDSYPQFTCWRKGAKLMN